MNEQPGKRGGVVGGVAVLWLAGIASAGCIFQEISTEGADCPCASGWVCCEGQCIPDDEPCSVDGGIFADAGGTEDACMPTTCVAEGWNCGAPTDRCGGTLSCGGCEDPDSCGGGGHDFVCGHGFCPGSYEITSVGDVAAVEECVAIEGELRIHGGFTFTLPLLEEVWGDVGFLGEFTPDSSHASLSGLPNLTTIGHGLVILGNTELVNTDGLENLTSVRLMAIDQNPGLTSVTGFDSLVEVDGIQIQGNEELTTISAFGNLTSLDVLGVFDNSGLTHLEAFGSLQEVGILGISWNESLVSLDGLENLTSVDVLRLEDNAALADISGLGGLTEVAQDVLITKNPMLANLEGLGNLVRVKGGFGISDNYGLVSLRLDGLAYVGDGPGISRNYSLPTCEVVALGEQLEAAGSPGELEYDNNLPDECGQ